MKNKLIFLSMILIIGSSISSCANRRSMAYFQPNENDTIVEGMQSYEMKFRNGDFLHIQVSGASQEAVEIFNPIPFAVTGNYTGSYVSDNPQVLGYIVDSQGNINFPVLGKIKVAGKTKLEVERTLLDKLQGHIDNPVINIRLRNFKISVLGDVKNPGTFTIASERITLPEAIGIAGDLNITAKRQNVLIVRNDNGKKKEYRIDLTSNDVFDSPAYYLQQNDVIYIEPNQAKINTSKYSPVYSILISVTSLIITTVILITNQ